MYPRTANARPIALLSCLFGIIFPSHDLKAETFTLPSSNDTVVGAVEHVRARDEETLIDIAREFDLGYDQIVKANPDVNRWIPGNDTKVILPHRYILPGTVRKGVVLNIPELRLYYYLPASKCTPTSVYTFPVSIGRMDWKTPIGTTKVVKKDRDPAWRPTQSIRDEHARDGDILPAVIPGGSPENPLGRFALRLGFPEYLIHGVDERKTYGIGMRVTHGCIRMYPTDIEALFPMVVVNTPVEIMNESIKLGWLDDHLFLEVHQPLNEGEDEDVPDLPRIEVNDVLRFVRERVPSTVSFDEEQVAAIAETGDGVPREIAQRAPQSLSLPPQDFGDRSYEAPKVVEASTNKRVPNDTREIRAESEYDKAIARHLAPPERPSQRSVTADGQAARRQAEPLAGSHQGAARRYIDERY